MLTNTIFTVRFLVSAAIGYWAAILLVHVMPWGLLLMVPFAVGGVLNEAANFQANAPVRKFRRELRKKLPLGFDSSRL